MRALRRRLTRRDRRHREPPPQLGPTSWRDRHCRVTRRRKRTNRPQPPATGLSAYPPSWTQAYSVCILRTHTGRVAPTTAPQHRTGGTEDVDPTRPAVTARRRAAARLPAAPGVRDAHRGHLAAQHRAGLHDARPT